MTDLGCVRLMRIIPKPCPLLPWKNCLSQNQSLVPKSLGTAALTHMYWASFKHRVLDLRHRRHKGKSRVKMGWPLKSSISKRGSCWNTQASWYVAARKVLKKETGLSKRGDGTFYAVRKGSFFHHSTFDDNFFFFLNETFLLQLGIMNLSETSSGRICTMSTYSWIFAGFTQRCWKKKINQHKSWKKKINQNKRFEKSLLIVSLGMFRPNKICNCYILLQISLTSKVTKYP